MLQRAQVTWLLEQEWWQAPGDGMGRGSGGFAARHRHTHSNGGDLGEENPDRWTHAETTVSDRWGHKGVEAHWQWHVEGGVTWAGFAIGLGRDGEFGPRRRNVLFFFHRNFQIHRSENKSGNNTKLPQKIMKICMKVDLNIWHNFCIGNFDQMSTIFK
jgi:hypothetical protein